jgi:hypothetical protein
MRKSVKGWMDQFHGVATKYIPNYLGWRRMYERSKYVVTTIGWIQAAARPMTQ